MPTYEYRCKNCGTFEAVQKITDPKLTVCPTCGAEVERLLSAAAFHLKGSGWYKTDYARSNGVASASDETPKADAADTTTKTKSESPSGEKKEAKEPKAVDLKPTKSD